MTTSTEHGSVFRFDLEVSVKLPAEMPRTTLRSRPENA